MTIINQSLLPQRLRESAFRRYEGVIAKCVSEFPTPVRIKDFGGLSILTFTARLRDAMASLSKYRWQSAHIHMGHFDECYKQMKVSHQGDCIIVGTAEGIKVQPLRAIPVPESIILGIPASGTIFHLVTLEQKKLICELAANRSLVGNVKCTGISVAEAEWLEANYDVEIGETSDGAHLIL